MSWAISLLPVILVVTIMLDMLQGRRWSWSTWLLLGITLPMWAFIGVFARGPIVLLSGTAFVGALVIGWLWMTIILQWPDRLRFVLIRSAILGGLWLLALLFILTFDPTLGWATLATGLLPLCGLGWSIYLHRVSIRIQVAELSDEAQEALLQKQLRGVENMRKRFRRKKLLAGALMGVGASYAKLGRMEEAREIFMEAGRLYRDLHDADMQVHALNYLGNTWSDTDPERSVTYYELAWASVEKQERRWGLLYQILGWADYPVRAAILLNNLGSVYIKLGQERQARPHLQEAVDVLDKARIEAPRLRVTVYTNLSELYQKMGQETEALRWAQAAQDALAGQRFMPPAEVEATRKLIAKHYREKLGLDPVDGTPLPPASATPQLVGEG